MRKFSNIYIVGINTIRSKFSLMSSAETCRELNIHYS